MGFLRKKDSVPDLLDLTLLQKRGILQKSQQLQKQDELIRENEVVDFTYKGLPDESASEAVNPLGFLDSLAKSASLSEPKALNFKMSNTDIQSIRVKIDDLEYKLGRLLDKISLIESKLSLFESKVNS
ncbi:MAG: hypothetical protein AABX65_00310 [Nanoarchaeota archaeon]